VYQASAQVLVSHVTGAGNDAEAGGET